MKQFPQILTVHYSYQFRANGTPMNWRERIGDVLRLLAQLIDGRISVSLCAATSPPIGKQRLLDCIHHGFDATRRAIESEVQTAGEETVLMQLHKELFDESKNGQPCSIRRYR